MGRYYQGDIEGKFWFGVQSSNDANHFGGSEIEIVDEETEDIYELGYSFTMDDIESINEGIATCIKDLGDYKEKLDAFFERGIGYNPAELARHLEVDAIKYRDIMESYARLQLGNQIKVCVWERGECNFTAEL